jgi:hypothetical protein
MATPYGFLVNQKAAFMENWMEYSSMHLWRRIRAQMPWRYIVFCVVPSDLLVIVSMLLTKHAVAGFFMMLVLVNLLYILVAWIGHIGPDWTIQNSLWKSGKPGKQKNGLL